MNMRRLLQYTGFALSLIAARALRRRRPLSVILCVTNRCNLRCWYCYGEHPYRRECREFTSQELLELVRELRRLGTRILQIQGGEPLLRDDLPVVLAEAKRLNMICDMVTNAVLLPKRPDVLQLLDKICISLDGPEAINDRNRGSGTFEKATAGIRCALEAGLPVRISAVLTSETTTNDIDWLIDFTQRNRALLNFSPSFDFVPQFRDDGFSPHLVPDDHLRMLLSHVATRKRNGAPLQFSAKCYEIAANWPFSYHKGTAGEDEFPAERRDHPKCRHGDYVVFIDSDGSVYPCCNFWGRPEWNTHRDGVEKALAGLSRHNCRACHIPAYIDRNRFLDGRISVWWNYFRQSAGG